MAVPFIPHLTQVCSHVSFTSLDDKGNVEYVLSTSAREYKRGEHGAETLTRHHVSARTTSELYSEKDYYFESADRSTERGGIKGQE